MFLLETIQFHRAHIVCPLLSASIFSEAYFGSLKFPIDFLAIITSKFSKPYYRVIRVKSLFIASFQSAKILATSNFKIFLGFLSLLSSGK